MDLSLRNLLSDVIWAVVDRGPVHTGGYASQPSEWVSDVTWAVSRRGAGWAPTPTASVLVPSIAEATVTTFVHPRFYRMPPDLVVARGIVEMIASRYRICFGCFPGTVARRGAFYTLSCPRAQTLLSDADWHSCSLQCRFAGT